tara:strand:+ start:39 stop:722 length:684 start_codon:yes stop_codon:yes gene_type:complete
MSAQLMVAGMVAANEVRKAVIKRVQQKKLNEEKKQSKMRQLKTASRLTGEEAQAMGRMKKGAEQGTMDVEKLNMQMAQPLYQQGEAQESQAMQKITAQGLEGSIVAQEVSRKIGGDVRASIANQARQIAMDNEKTKADAERRYQESLMKRGQFLREMAMKKTGVQEGFKIGEMQSKQAFASELGDAAGDFATSAYSNGAPNLSFNKTSRELRNDYTREELEEMGIYG